MWAWMASSYLAPLDGAPIVVRGVVFRSEGTLGPCSFGGPRAPTRCTGCRWHLVGPPRRRRPRIGLRGAGCRSFRGG